MSLQVRHIVIPGYTQAAADAVAGETLAAFKERNNWKFQLPTIACINDKPYGPSKWDELIIMPDDEVSFISRPFGGGGGGGGKQTKSIIALLAIVALTAIAGPAGTLVSGALFAGSVIAASVISAVIVVGGSLLISTLLAPKPGGQEDPAKQQELIADQVYSLTATSNTARLLGAQPRIAGKIKCFPPYATDPWAEYIGDDEYLNILLYASVGKIQLHKIYTDDTELWDSVTGLSSVFTDTTIVTYQPNTPVTLFPLNVTTAAEVSGIVLPDPNVTPWIGGFIVNSSGTTINAIAVDLGLLAGLFAYNQKTGEFIATSVSVIAEKRRVDSAGAPIESFTELFHKDYVMKTRTPKRMTEKVAVPSGRYEVRVRRTDVPNKSLASGGPDQRKPEDQNDIQKQDEISWLALRGYVEGPSTFEHGTVIAIRMRATGQLSQQGAKSFGILATGVSPVWNGSTFVDQAHQNPIWTAFDMMTNTSYGARRLLSKTDIVTFIDMAAAADARQDTFNYVFTDQGLAPQVFDKILTTTRVKHRWAGDVITLVRDEWKPIPQILLTDSQIIRGSLNIDYVFNDENQADAVITEYLDETTWGPAELQYPPDSLTFTAQNPTRIRLDGITKREQIHRETGFYYLQAFYRRIFLTCDTEHDGRLLGLLSPVRIQSELPQTWGQTGDILAVAGFVLTVDRALTWEVGQNYVNIRTKTGGAWGPVKVSQGVDAKHIVVDSADAAIVAVQMGMTLAEALDYAVDAECPTFDFGLSTKLSKHCIVLSGRPQGDKVTLELVVDRIEVHDTDLDDVPVLPPGVPLGTPKRPILEGLSANFRQGVVEPMIDVSWFAAPGAFYYKAAVSYDGGEGWTPVYEGTQTAFYKTVNRADLLVRVAAVGQLHGPYTIVPLTVPDIFLGPSIGPIAFVDGLREHITQLEDRVKQLIKDYESVSSVGVAEQDATQWLSKVKAHQFTRTEIFKVSSDLEGITADITETADALATLEGAFASYQITVDVRFDTAEANILLNATAISDANTAFASYQVVVDARFDTAEANISTNSTAISTLSGSFAQHVIDVSTNYTTSGVMANARAHTASTATSTANAAVASYDNSTIATIGTNLSAAVNQHQSSIATIDGKLLATWQVTTNVNGYIAGIKLYNNGATAAFVISADVFQVAWPGSSGPIPIFTLSTVGGVGKLTFRGDMYADGSISAIAVVTHSLSADQIAVGGVDLLSLLDGAATNFTQANRGTIGISPGANIVDLTTSTAKVGRVFVLVSFELNGTYSSAIPCHLRIDGSRVKTWVAPVPLSYDSVNNVMRQGNSGHTNTFAVSTFVSADPNSGISHHYELEIESSLIPPSGSPSCGGVTVLVLESRR